MNEVVVVIISSIVGVITQIIPLADDKKTDKIIKRVFLISTFILIIISLAFSVSEIFERKIEKIAQQNELQRKHDSTILKLDTSIQKGTIILDSLANVETKIRGISDTLNQQLLNQKEISSKTQSLLTENKKILASQTSIYKNTDRALHALFPLTFTLDFDVPFNNTKLESLIKYLSDLKSDFENNPGLIDTRRVAVLSSKPNFKDITELSFNYTLIKEPSLSFDSLFISTFEISLIKAPLKKVSDLKPSMPQLHFMVSDFDEINDRYSVFIHTYFRDSLITFSLRYNDYELQNSEYHQTNTTIGSNELDGCTVAVSHYNSELKGFRLKSISFTPRLGLQRPCTIIFTEKDVAAKTWDRSEKTYIHRISELDFKYLYRDN